MNKVAIIGAGQVGSTLAQRIVESGTADVAMVDIVEGLARGKALDIAQSLSFFPVNTRIEGGKEYTLAEGADIVVITAGLPRKPGMSRSDLLQVNAAIIRGVVAQICQVAPEALMIMVTNPLDEMAYLAWRLTKWDKHRIMGMAGTLDCARFQYFLARELGVPPSVVKTIILGSHGDSMVPLKGYTQVKGVPVTSLLSREKIDELAARARDGGAEIISYLKTGSAYYAPSAAVFRLIRSLLGDEKSILPASVLLEGEYGIEGVFLGVPVRLGRKGWEDVIELELDEEEKRALLDSARTIQGQIEQLEKWLLAGIDDS
jgi:malate dehydrogenase